jgi:intein/homing endonuclease
LKDLETIGKMARNDMDMKRASMKVEITGYEHLHLHSDFSTLDGFGQVEEYCVRAPKINQKFLTISDHGMMGAVPRQIKGCEKINDKFGKDTLSPIFAVELYINRLQSEMTEENEGKKIYSSLTEMEQNEFKSSSHLLAIAINEEGYKNLVRLSSWGWTKGFYRRPRVNYEQLKKYKQGIIFTSCCYASEIGKAFERGGEDEAFSMIERYIEMFGKEQFYLEIMLLDFKKQKPYDKFIVKAKEKYGLKIILTNDCHYCNKEDSHYQRLMLMIQTNRTIAEIEKALKEDSDQDFFELQDANLWMKSEEELNEKWLSDYHDAIPYEIFCEAKRTTVEICNRAKGVQLDRSLKLPVIPDADEKLKEEIMMGFQRRGLPKTREYLDRIKEEFSLITRKGFTSYFLIQKMMTDEARRVCRDLLGFGDGSQAVGPGRGCLEGSTLIVMGNGVCKRLDEVVTGDFVFTHDGTRQKVLNTAKYAINEKLHVIHTYYGDNRGVALTNDHKVLAVKGKNSQVYEKCAISTQNSINCHLDPQIEETEWLPANQIEVGDWLFVPDIILDDSSSKIDFFCYKVNFPKTSLIGLDEAEKSHVCRKVKGGNLLLVRNTGEKDGVDFVYDIQVENNTNYLTSSFIVHNSACGSLVCYCLGITSVDPVREGLLFSRFMSEARGGRSIKLEFNNIDPLPPDELS